MVDVFEEVEGELQAERWSRLARKFGPWIAAALLAALLIAGGVWGYQAWRTGQAEKASIAYDRGMKALERGDAAAAEAAFTEAADAGSGAYEALALMQRAGVLLGQDKVDEAVALFDEAAGATRDPLIADNARLKAAFALMDGAPYAAVEERLTPLTEEGRPYRPMAREALAMAKLQAGQAAAARSDFAVLSLAQDVPEGVRARAQAAMQMIDSGTAAGLPAIVTAAAALPAEQRAGAFNPFAEPQPGQPAPPPAPAQ